ncbi:MAG: hypothetical protein QOH62_1732 [Solirubrobacteraceae bacterium]|jgi:hypothetical protein|nr:hypothetical protein [Solirubrobacteraceae bacterium]
MTFSRVRTISSLALASAAVLALPAGSAVAKTTFPVIKKVTPMQVGVGDLLTIKGSGYRSGKNKNTVVFKRSGQRAIFVKAETATTKTITLHVPLKLQAYMTVKNNQPVPSRFLLRIIAKRFGQKFTSTKLSPLIGPAGSGITAPGVTPPSAYEQCLSKAQANPAGDEDTDSLSNDLERKLGTDPCRADTDTDGMSDGWEYQSALDLNSRALPYPGKKPWPNALDPTDLNNDFDGDGLNSWQEYALWQYVGSPFNPDGTLAAYSDGTQNTGGMVLTSGNPSLQALDMNGDGNLSDQERDADGDGLSNFVESNMEGQIDWWTKVYDKEKPYTARVFAETSPTDPDSDGDGVLDGADDQDNDGYDNFTEMQRGRWGTGWRVQPFNPCLPDPYTLTCGQYYPIPVAERWPPFDGTEPVYVPAHGISPAIDGAAIPFTWTTPPVTVSGGGWNGTGGPQGPGG